MSLQKPILTGLYLTASFQSEEMAKTGKCNLFHSGKGLDVFGQACYNY